MPNKVCPICKLEFHCKPSSFDRRICCSKKCINKYRSNNPDNVWTKCQCNNCGKGFQQRTYRVQSSKNHFCSRRCSSEWRTKQTPNYQVTLSCEICSSSFKRTRYFVNIRNNSRFCSRKCLDYYNSINKRQEKNVNWAGGKFFYYGPNWCMQKRLARERDSNKCVLCGHHPKIWYLDIHHIKPFRSFAYIPGINDNYIQANDLSNLITLCKKCHRAVERNPNLIYKLNVTPTVI